MADYYQLKNQNIFNPPANTSLGNATNQFDDVYVQNELVLGNTAVTGATINTPKVSTITYPGDDTAADPAGGQTITLTGSGFLVGATVLINNVEVSVVSVVSSTTITFTSPANSTGSYVLYVINTDGGTAIAIPGIQYSGTPTWTTAAGSLGSVYETQSFNSTVTATGDAPITYSVASGTLPPGATFNSNGTITGTSELLASPTTYTFTVSATDAELQDTNRTFSLTINPDVVTWNSPANGTSYSVSANSAISNVTLDATSAVGSGIAYSANALPDGISLSGNTISGTPTVAANSSSLLTATANTTSESANITINWVISVSNDTYFEYNTLLIPGASTTFVDDASTNNFAVTVWYDTKPNNFNPYTPGYYSNYFDGSGDYLTTAASDAVTFGTGDYTIECWVYATTISDARCVFFTNTPSSYTHILRYAGTTDWQLYFPGGNTAVALTSSNSASNFWVHHAITRSSGTLKWFINGVQVYSVANSTSVTDTVVTIGNYAGYYWSGYISNLRIVKGTALYTSNFTPSTTPLTAISNTSLLTCQSNRIIDNSTNNLTITRSGDTTVNSFDPFIPNTSYSTYGSGYFDGTGDYLSVPGNSVFAFGTGDFTIEVWLYANSISTGTFDRICATSDYNGSGFDWALNSNSSALFLAATSYNIGSITPKVWHHLVYTRSGSVIRGFLNGKLSSYTTGASQNITSTSNLNIGVGYSGTYLNGYLVDLRIIKGSIPAGYQTSSTTTGTQIFTPPTEPLTAISGTSLLTLQNNQSVNNNVFLDNSTNNLLVTRTGNTTQGTFSPYGGNWSNYFDGTGDYLSTPNNAALNFGTGNFTIESWIYITSFSSINSILDKRLISGDAAPWRWYVGTDGKLNFDNGTAYTTSSTLSVNTWVHVVVSRVSGTLYQFINGVSAMTPTSVTANLDSTGSLLIGTSNYSPPAYLSGYISNLRIVKGSGVTSVTVPTVPLTAISGTSLLTCQSNRIVDNSINNFTITKNGDTSVQRFSPFNPSSVTPTSYSGYFGSANGNSLYLSAQSSGTGGVALSGDYTIEMWLYPTAASGSGYSMLVATNTNGGVIQLYYNSSGALGYYSPVAGQLTTSSAPLTFNAWQHVAFVRSSNVVKVYVNGVEKAFSSTITDSSTVYANYIGGLGTVYNTFGYISNLRVNNTAIYTSGFTPPTSPLTAISGTQLLTLQSSTIIDNSTNNYTISTVGSPQPSIQNPFGYTSATTEGYSVSTIGGSAYFDGTGDYLSVANSSVWSSLPGDFTIECWFYLNSVSIAQQLIFSQRTSAAGYCPYLIWVTNTTITLYSSSNNGSWNIISGDTIASGLTAGQWYHLAFTRSGSTNRIFLNGVQTYTYTNNASFTNNNTFNLGMAPGETNTALNGYITDARLVNGTALYTSNFVPPAQPLTAVKNTGLLTNMTNAGIYDASMMNDMESVGDAKLSTAVSKFGGSSMYFDGTGDYLKFPSNQIYSFGTGDFTIEGWLYFTGNQNFGSIFISSTTGAGNSLHIQINNANKVRVTNETTQFLLATNAISLSTWTHIAVVRSGTTLSIYQNGTLNGSTTNSTDFIQNGALVGLEPTGGSFYYDGYIDDLRVTKGYARYTSNFTPPTSAFPTY